MNIHKEIENFIHIIHSKTGTVIKRIDIGYPDSYEFEDGEFAIRRISFYTMTRENKGFNWEQNTS